MSKIALGTVQFGLDYGVASVDGKVDSSEVKNILDYARQQNIDLLDTAPAYGDSEQVLGDANTQDFSIVTKTRHFHGNTIGHHEIDLMQEDFLHSLSNLKQDRVYGVLMHNADDLFKVGADQLMEKLYLLKQAGKVDRIGASVYDAEQLSFILDHFDIDLVQLPFNILDSRLFDGGMLSRLNQQEVEVHARSVFLQGLLLMNQQSRPSKFDRWHALWNLWHEWLNDHNMTALEATIRHAILTPEISKVLVGVDTQQQLEDIVMASRGILPQVPAELLTEDADLLNPSNWSKL